MGACWAHNPEVRGSKPRSASNCFIYKSQLKAIYCLFDFFFFPLPINLEKTHAIHTKRWRTRLKSPGNSVRVVMSLVQGSWVLVKRLVSKVKTEISFWHDMFNFQVFSNWNSSDGLWIVRCNVLYQDVLSTGFHSRKFHDILKRSDLTIAKQWKQWEKAFEFSAWNQNRHPFIVVGRIRTCAGKPQWISSPSP